MERKEETKENGGEIDYCCDIRRKCLKLFSALLEISAALRRIVPTEPGLFHLGVLNLILLFWYLDLFVVADGSDGRGDVQRALCAAGAELHHRLGPPHEACHRTPILDKLFLLLLQEKLN